MVQAQKRDKLFFFDGGVLDDIVGSAADALVAADGLHVGRSLDFLEGLLGALSALGQGLVDVLLSGDEVLVLSDLQQGHPGAGVLLRSSADSGSEALAGLMDLAQVAVEAQALHLQLLLDLLHLLLIGALDENAGQLALSGCGQLGEDGVLGAVERGGVFVVVELLTDLGAELVHGVHIGSLLGKNRCSVRAAGGHRRRAA